MPSFARVFAAPALAFVLTAAHLAAPPAAWARYVVDHGDTLSIEVRDANQYNYTGSIRPDGVITIRAIGDVEVRGLTTDEVRDKLRAIIGKVVRDPVITVAVSSYRPRTVMVFGEVVRPGNVDLTRADQSVLDTIAAAGGLTDHALGDQIVVLRGNGATTRRIPVNLDVMLKTGDLTANVKLEPGDRVQVPRNPWPTLRDVTTTFTTTVTTASTIFLLLNLIDRIQATTQK